MNKAQRDQLKKDWSALSFAADSLSETKNLLKEALRFLVKAERIRRTCTIFPGCREPGAYPTSVLDTAKVIILVNMANKSRYKLTWLEAATCRKDILCARALREKLDSMKRWPFRLTGPETAKLDVKDYWHH
jgi:hypothetical protein